MGYMASHNDWFELLSGGASERAASIAAGMNQATLNRQLKRGTLPAETVIALARAYARKPVRALVETEYLRPDEAGKLTPAEALQMATDQELIRELASRIDSEPSHWHGTFESVIHEVELPSMTLVRGMPDLSSDGSDMPLGAVADSSPDEDWEGAEFDT